MEKAVDTGGMSRDIFSVFWECAYPKEIDGGDILLPASHPGVDMQDMVMLGTILSHGFLSCGYLPIRLAFPALCLTVLGPTWSGRYGIIHRLSVTTKAFAETNSAFTEL